MFGILMNPAMSMNAINNNVQNINNESVNDINKEIIEECTKKTSLSINFDQINGKNSCIVRMDGNDPKLKNSNFEIVLNENLYQVASIIHKHGFIKIPFYFSVDYTHNQLYDRNIIKSFLQHIAGYISNLYGQGGMYISIKFELYKYNKRCELENHELSGLQSVNYLGRKFIPVEPLYESDNDYAERDFNGNPDLYYQKTLIGKCVNIIYSWNEKIKKFTVKQYKDKVSNFFRNNPRYEVVFLDLNNNIANDTTLFKDVRTIKYTGRNFAKNPFISDENTEKKLNIQNVLSIRNEYINMYFNPIYIFRQPINYLIQLRFDLNLSPKNINNVLKLLNNMSTFNDKVLQQENEETYARFPINIKLNLISKIFKNEENIQNNQNIEINLLNKTEIDILKMKLGKLNKAIKDLVGAN